VVRHAGLVEMINQHFGSRAPTSALRLAEVPEGTELLSQDGSWYPVLCCDNIFMLPGVPQFFRFQLDVVLKTLPTSRIHLRNLYLGVGEIEVAEILNRVADAWPQVLIGSYPDFAPSSLYRVKVTVEHEDSESVEATVAQLLRELPSGVVLRVD
jgi:molybdopterin-biosynthesis enzyme MoeA-like protein